MNELEQLKREFKKNRVVGFSYDPKTREGGWHIKPDGGKSVFVGYNPKDDPERMVNEFTIAVIDDVALVHEDYFLSNNAYWTLFVKAFHKALNKRMHKANIEKSKRGLLVSRATKNLKEALAEKYGKIEYGKFSEKDQEVLTRMKREYDMPVPRYH